MSTARRLAGPDISLHAIAPTAAAATAPRTNFFIIENPVRVQREDTRWKEDPYAEVGGRKSEGGPARSPTSDLRSPTSDSRPPAPLTAPALPATNSPSAFSNAATPSPSAIP